MYSHLFRPLRLRGVELKNRVGISAHFAGWWVDEGLPTEAFAAYIEERAKGGIGLFVVGATAVRWDGGPTWMQNLDDCAIPRCRMLVEAAHRHGTKLFAQLIHCGDRPLPGLAVIADPPRSDALPPARRMPLPPLRTVEDLKDLVWCFAEAARRALEGGADGIEIHSHESFFHAQMLSPLWNRRTDAYGGGFENRLRFLMETLAGIRDRAGQDFPLGVRLKADDMAEGGMGEVEYAEVLRLLEASGLVDYFSLTGGDGAMHHGPFPRPDGEWLDLIGRLRSRTRLPVMHAGRITTAEMAEEALAAGKLDVALMTKSHIADPHFVRKVAEGRRDEIRYCTRCLQSCVGKMEAMTCIYNPVTSREATWATLAPAACRKRVVIVGAGPAGMEAAITAAGRGHEVIVLEKSEQVGGQVRYASRSPHRMLFGRIWEFYERAAARGAFSVRHGVDAGLDAILALAPDAVVIATGSRPRRATLPGEGPAPLTIHEALDGAADGAERVVIVDREGFTRPVVVADALSAKGIEVVFLTPFLSVSPELNSMSREELHARLLIEGVTFHPGEDAAGWVGGALLVRRVLTAETRRISGVDAVVIAAGSEPVNELALALDGQVPELHVIGDANYPKTVEEATYQGGRVGRLL